MPRVYVKKGGNGGRRPGAGRPKGSKTQNGSQLPPKPLREKYPDMSLELWLTILNDTEASFDDRWRAAAAAAPYVHQRLSPGKPVPEPCPNCARYNLDLLSDDELALMEQLLLKCTAGLRNAGSA